MPIRPAVFKNIFWGTEWLGPKPEVGILEVLRSSHIVYAIKGDM